MKIRNISVLNSKTSTKPKHINKDLSLHLQKYTNTSLSPPQNPITKSSFSSEADFGEITLISVRNYCTGWWKLYINIKGPLGSIKKNFSCSGKLKRNKKTKPWLPSCQLAWTHGIKSYDVLNSGDTKVLGPRFQSTEENKIQ